ncbi:molybdenum cofactor biosynthesis protein MoaE [Jiella marina]|uniref:molybdenum cofactor biosynthesis protein MoaE n=1 Tax=Jiella sp. LLJ827 TaxID=2917712 RepID=UPI00210190C3|nr:molybdenum cofactor biosynthesis protein MoaE [Jiella sp. LLJ827]MCQ0988359.1 molybdenum cofactor biosynthesis protein MoaE [Jiella sp. LLJ827]
MANETNEPRTSPPDMAFEPLIRVQSERIVTDAVVGPLAGNGSVGALVTFTGYCRDEGGRLKELELEHYPGMAERQIAKIAQDAASRWPLLGCAAIHRYGLIAPGEEIVLVACTSAHRGAAFEAASFLMDFMKTRAPFWKREHLVDGSVGGWVEARDTDTAAADRWHRL